LSPSGGNDPPFSSVQAVLEAIDYCLHHQELLDADRARESARMKAAGRDQRTYISSNSKPEE
jgi:hypothetical protein